MRDVNKQQVSGEIEDAYAEIGRTVVEAAIQKARRSDGTSDEGVEAMVTIRLLFERGVTERLPVTCCVCMPDAQGGWVCAGPCCPVENSSWQ